MSQWRRWVRPGLATTVVLALIAFLFRSGTVEDDLRSRVTGELLGDGFEWAVVEVSGRAVTIRGTAPSPEAQEQAVASAASVAGVSSAENGSDLLPIASPYVWSARKQGRVVTLSGSVPSEATRNSVLAAARRALPDAEIRDEMSLARGAAPTFNSAAAFALDRLAGMTEGVLTVTDGTLTASGVAASSASYAEARGAFLNNTPRAVVLGPVDVLPARADPFVWSATYDGKTIVLDGYVPNEVVHETLVAAARAVLGPATVEDRMRTASGEPDGFAEAASFAIATLGRFSDGGITLDGLNLDIAGTARSVDDYEEVIASLSGGLPRGIAIVANAIRPATVENYGWSATRLDDQVTLTGYVPTREGQAEIAALARNLFPDSQVTNDVRVAAGEPKMDWIGAVKFALQQVSRLSSGFASLGDRTFAIEGTAASPEAFAELMAINERALPASLRLEKAEILAPRVSPYRFLVERAPGRITISGYVGGAKDHQTVIDAARRKFGAAEITDRLAFASGAPDGFVEATGVALDSVARLAGGRAEIVDGAVRIDGGVYSATAADEIVTAVTESLPSGFKPEFNVVTRQPGQPLSPEGCRDHLQSELRVGRIEFDGGRANVTRDSLGLLDRVAATLVRCPETRIEIAAHSDSDGSSSRNRDLTQSRAEAIVDYLVDAGVARERMAAIGYGEDKPIADNASANGKAANRRIEFTVELPGGG